MLFIDNDLGRIVSFPGGFQVSNTTTYGLLLQSLLTTGRQLKQVVEAVTSATVVKVPQRLSSVLYHRFFVQNKNN